MELRIAVAGTPSDADRDTVLAPLRAYNISEAGDPHNERWRSC
jgi:hypothetical protein